MKIIKILVAIILVISFSNCKEVAQKSVPNSTETDKISLLDTLTLKMNNGEKWIVNNATQVGVTKMDSIIKSFISNNKDDFIALGNDLSKQTSFIIKSCDMTGEAHDQLHVILVPMLDEISALKESSTKVEAKTALNKMGNLIEGYFSHFQAE